MNSPVNLLHSAKLFVRRHQLAVGLFILVVFKFWLVQTEETYGSATEYDVLWFVNAAKYWYWGSQYSWTAFVRPPAYPLFIAVVHAGDEEVFEPGAANRKEAGIFPKKEGWCPEIIKSDIDAVIWGMQARQDNPELQKALSIGVKIYSFPGYIYQESISKKRVAIGGSHGKTTTTAMIMHILNYAKVDFDYLVGARLKGFDQSVKVTNANLIICEADEYPASTLENSPKFHFLFPHIAV